MGLANITGNTQTSVIGALLILSVLAPNLVQMAHGAWKGRHEEVLTASAALAALAFSGSAFAQATATPGQEVSMVLLPKFLGIAVFDQAHEGALEAQKELQNPTELQFLGPTPENSVAGQIEIVTNATTQGVDAIMISNNSGDQIVPAVKAPTPNQGGDLGLADPVSRGRGRLRRPGRLLRDRQGDGRDGAEHPRRGGRPVRDSSRHRPMPPIRTPGSRRWRRR